MNIKKITGGLAAALPIVMLSGMATADHVDVNDVATEIFMHAEKLACDYTKDAEGNVLAIAWADANDVVYTAPIWQHKGKVGSYGCVVHDSLAKQLYVPHDSPPIGRGKTKAVAKGAANDLWDGKFDSAVKHICTFIDVIENNARLNSVDDFSPTTAYGLAMDQVSTAKEWLYDLHVDPTECYEILGGY